MLLRCNPLCKWVFYYFIQIFLLFFLIIDILFGVILLNLIIIHHMNRQVVHIDKDILGGTPVFYGTRVPIKNLFDYLESGDTIEDFLVDFESVQKSQILELLELSQKLLESNRMNLYENIA